MWRGEYWVMLHRLYATSPELLTFLLPDLLQYRIYASCLFLYYLRVRLGYDYFLVERCGQYRLGTEHRGQDRLGGRAQRSEVHKAAVKPRASRSDVKYSRFGVVQRWSMADLRRSKNTPQNIDFLNRNRGFNSSYISVALI